MCVRGESLLLIASSLLAAVAAEIRVARITAQAVRAAVYRATTAKTTTVDTPQVAVEPKMQVVSRVVVAALEVLDRVPAMTAITRRVAVAAITVVAAAMPQVVVGGPGTSEAFPVERCKWASTLEMERSLSPGSYQSALAVLRRL